MHIVIDGMVFAWASFGGIWRIYKNILPLMCDLDPGLQIKIFFSAEPRAAYPEHRQIAYLRLDKIFNILRPWRLWRPFHGSISSIILTGWVGSTRNKLWLSTYYTQPLIAWQGTNVVLTHDFMHERFPELLPESDREILHKKRAIQSAQKIFCNSRSTAIDLQIFYAIPEEKITVAHLSHDSVFKCRSRAEIKTQQPDRFILYVGQRRFYKGFDTLINAYTHWPERQHIRLLVVGPGWSAEEQQTITAKGLGEDVVLMQNVDDDSLCDLYNQAEAFVYPSLYEGFGIPVLEAMACGCPVIATQIPSTQEVAADVPIYFEPGDPATLLAALDAAMVEDIRQARVARGIAQSKLYSWDKTAITFYHALRELYDSI